MDEVLAGLKSKFAAPSPPHGSEEIISSLPSKRSVVTNSVSKGLIDTKKPKYGLGSMNKIGKGSKRGN